MARKKVTIVGAGATGGAMAQRLIERDICDVVLQDDPQFAGTMHHGKALDESPGRRLGRLQFHAHHAPPTAGRRPRTPTSSSAPPARRESRA